MPTCARRTDEEGVEDAPLFGFLLAKNPQLLEGIRIEQPSMLYEQSYTSTNPAFEYPPLLAGCSIPSHNVMKAIVYQPLSSAGLAALDKMYMAERRTAATLSDLRRKVATFAHLGANWDGEGAEAPSPQTVASGEQVIERIAIILERRDTSAEPSVLPFPDGSIFFKLIQGQKELAITVLGRTVEAQRWHPLDAFHSQGLWQIQVDDVREHIEWVLT